MSVMPFIIYTFVVLVIGKATCFAELRGHSEIAAVLYALAIAAMAAFIYEGRV